jgi:hypothetical protein
MTLITELEFLQAFKEGAIDAILEGVPLDRATPRWEYRKGVYSALLNSPGAGPYLYLYWNDPKTKKLKKHMLVNG